MEKIQRHEPRIQNVIKTAAALSARFDLVLLKGILGELYPGEWTNDDLVNALDLAVCDGLLEEYYDHAFRFSHDRIQQAAYSLIPEGPHREKLHLQIGITVLGICNKTDYDSQMLFVAADQMNLGADRIIDAHERIELARLNYRVGLNAKRVSAFFPASKYFDAALDLLGDEAWEEHKDLTLKIHIEATEANESCGEVDKALKLAETLLKKSSMPDARHRAHVSKVQCLVNQTKLADAVTAGQQYILTLGEKLPKRVGLFRMIKSLIKTKRLLKKYSDEEILTLPTMTNAVAINACSMYQKTAEACYFMQRTMDMAVMIFRIVQLTFKYGIGELSPFGFTVVGFVLAGMGEIKDACRLVNLSLNLLDRLKSPAHKPKTISLAHAFVMPWQQPIQDSLKPLLACHKMAMEVGDAVYSANTIIAYTNAYRFSGLSLTSLDSDLKHYSRHIADYNQGHYVDPIYSFHQGIRNLIVKREDPTCLDGELIGTEEEYVKKSTANDNEAALQQFYLSRFCLSFYFNQLDEALTAGKEFSKRSETVRSHNQYWLYTFINSLVQVEAYRRTRRWRHKRAAAKALKEMETWVKQGNVNVVHHVMIAKAELLSLYGKTNDVKAAFEKGISAASRTGYIQDAALATERLAYYYHGKGDSHLADHYFTMAYTKYETWGAHAKALHLRSSSGWQAPTSMAFSSSGSEANVLLKGRKSYDKAIAISHRNLPRNASVVLSGSATSNDGSSQSFGNTSAHSFIPTQNNIKQPQINCIPESSLGVP